MTYEQYRLIRDALIVASVEMKSRLRDSKDNPRAGFGSVQFYSACSATIEKAFEATKMENLK